MMDFRNISTSLAKISTPKANGSERASKVANEYRRAQQNFENQLFCRKQLMASLG